MSTAGSLSFRRTSQQRRTALLKVVSQHNTARCHGWVTGMLGDTALSRQGGWAGSGETKVPPPTPVPVLMKAISSRPLQNGSLKQQEAKSDNS